VVENLQPRSEEMLWRGLRPRAVRRGAFYYPTTVKPGCRRSHRQTQEWQLYSGVCAIILSGKIPQKCLMASSGGFENGTAVVW